MLASELPSRNAALAKPPAAVGWTWRLPLGRLGTGTVAVQNLPTANFDPHPRFIIPPPLLPISGSAKRTKKRAGNVAEARLCIASSCAYSSYYSDLEYLALYECIVYSGRALTSSFSKVSAKQGFCVKPPTIELVYYYTSYKYYILRIGSWFTPQARNWCFIYKARAILCLIHNGIDGLLRLKSNLFTTAVREYNAATSVLLAVYLLQVSQQECYIQYHYFLMTALCLLNAGWYIAKRLCCIVSWPI